MPFAGFQRIAWWTISRPSASASKRFLRLVEVLAVEPGSSDSDHIATVGKVGGHRVFERDPLVRDKAEEIKSLVVTLTPIVPYERVCRAIEIQPVAEGVLQQIAAELGGGDPLAPVFARPGSHVVAGVVVRQVPKVHFVTLQEKTPPGRTITLPAVDHGFRPETTMARAESTGASGRIDHGSGAIRSVSSGLNSRKFASVRRHLKLGHP